MDDNITNKRKRVEQEGNEDNYVNRVKIDDNDEKSVPTLALPSSSSDLGTGFGCYAKANPFKNVKGTGNSFLSFGSSSSSSSFNTTNTAAISATTSETPAQSKTNGLSALIIPQSPKSPNPFAYSSPSQPNPFVRIVDSKDIEPFNVVTRADSTDNATTNASSAISSSSSSKGESIYFREVIAKHSSAEDKDNYEDDGSDADNTNNNNDDENEAIGAFRTYQFPENVEIVTGEENEECLCLVRVKLYRFGKPRPNATDSETSSSSNSNSSSGITEKVEETTNKNNSSHVETVVGSASSDNINNSVYSNSISDNITSSSSSSSSSSSCSNGTSNGSSNNSGPEITDKPAEWIESGVGPIKVLADNGIDINTSSDIICTNSEKTDNNITRKRKHRLVMRREDKKGGQGTKLVLNSLIDGYSRIYMIGDKLLRLSCINAVESKADGPILPSTYLIKLSNEKDAIKLFEIIKSTIHHL